MQLKSLQSSSCDRAREGVSLRLDGELSEFEHVRLDAHLARCGACAEFASDVTATSLALRGAPYEVLQKAIELPGRPASRFSRTAGGAVAAAAVAAAFILALVLPGGHVQVGPPQPRISQSNNDDLRDLQILQRAQRTPASIVMSRPLHGPEA